MKFRWETPRLFFTGVSRRNPTGGSSNLISKVLALVLAGGNTAGFGVLTRNRAKAALGFAGHYRVCDFVLSNLCNSGVLRAGLLIQYLPSSLVEHVGSGRWWDFEGARARSEIMPPFIGFKHTEWFKGTADSVYRNLDFLTESSGEHAMILSCEHVYRMDYREVLATHIKSGAAMTLVMTRLPRERLTSRYGYLEFEPDTGRLTSFTEKPATPPNDHVFTGIALFRRNVLVSKLLDYGRNPGNHNLTRDVIAPLIQEEPCYVHELDGYWNYLEDLGEYYDVHMEMALGKSPVDPGAWNLMTSMDDRDLGSMPPAYYSPSAEVVDSLVSPGARIYGRVARSVISPGVVIEEDAVVRGFHPDAFMPGRAQSPSAARDQRQGFDFRPGMPSGAGPEQPEGINPELPRRHRQLVVVGKTSRIAPGLEVPPATQLYPGTDTETLGLAQVLPGSNLCGDEPRSPSTDLGAPIRIQ
jgi:glucose-1-phosphate adenylyltransferase